MGATATKTTDADAELRARVERLENENTVLKAAFSDVARRLGELEAERKAELEDYERREAALYAFAEKFPEPPDYGTDDPWEIAKLAGQQLTPEELRTFFDED